MTDIHCPMIHGGLQINLKKDPIKIYTNHCCLRQGTLVEMKGDAIWNDPSLIPLRELNKNNIWDNECWTCKGNELAGITSLRNGMLKKFGKKTNLSGPARLDLMFDINCNLACRSCGPSLSTYWQKHLKDNNIIFAAPKPESRVNDMIAILKTLDLSNLEMVVFCGGETLLGQGYWRVAEVIADIVPNAKEKLTISFQTNGTQSIAEQNFKIIEKFHLVKLNISLDGINEKFEYLRWPANWQQVTSNIITLNNTLPANVMFLIEETMGVLNLHYQYELEDWTKTNFATNRLGDTINHTRHVANGIFGLASMTNEYVDSLLQNKLRHIIPSNWEENTATVNRLLLELKKFDIIRKQDWRKTFPEVAAFYNRFDTFGI
jgi:sulfatase maturation enzyme AslB (radical SAM superfamily)